MAGPEQIWTEAVRALERGQPFALATVIKVRGSTPREIGAKMMVCGDSQFGTIGGGCGEAEVFRKAEVLLKEGQGARLTEVDLTGDFDQDEVGTCGGIMDVFVNLWSPAQDLAIARRLAGAAGADTPAALLTLIDPGRAAETPAGARLLIDPAGNGSSLAIRIPARSLAQLIEQTRAGVAGLFEVAADGLLKPAVRIEPSGALRVFLDPVAGALRLIIVGAGHIAQPLTVVGKLAGFRVTVIDDRAAFANRERFPAADEIIVKPFAAAIDSLILDRYCCLVAITRGHSFDQEVVRAALRQPCGFVGMIGSRRRVSSTLERLGADGLDAESLERVHAPLGLDIGAETPEEIALSIISEMVRERRLGVRDQFSLGVKLGRLKPSP